MGVRRSTVKNKKSKRAVSATAVARETVARQAARTRGRDLTAKSAARA